VRYLVGALVLLGLIGTFYGLLLTIAGVRDVIGGLSVEKAADTMALIANFKERLAAPLGGMGGLRSRHLCSGCWARWRWAFWNCNCSTRKTTITLNWKRWW